MKYSQRALVGRWPLVAATLFLALVSQPAWAYLDPGTGSMIISAVVGLFATVGLAVKTYWYKLKGFLRSDAQPAEAGGDPALNSDVEQGSKSGHSIDS